MKICYVKLITSVSTLPQHSCSVNTAYLLHQVNSIIPDTANIVNYGSQQAKQAANIVNAPIDREVGA